MHVTEKLVIGMNCVPFLTISSRSPRWPLSFFLSLICFLEALSGLPELTPLRWVSLMSSSGHETSSQTVTTDLISFFNVVTRGSYCKKYLTAPMKRWGKYWNNRTIQSITGRFIFGKQYDHWKIKAPLGGLRGSREVCLDFPLTKYFSLTKQSLELHWEDPKRYEDTNKTQ